MNAVDVKHRITDEMLRHSRFEADRKYLGMSRISECPLKLYRECLNGRAHEAGEPAARRAYRGLLFEGDVRQRMITAGVYKPDSHREVIAPFDERFRGHTDGETLDGDLVEIKSCRDETYQQVRESRRPMPSHYDQVQLYMAYGGYKHAVLIYINTETFEHYILDCYPNRRTQEILIDKARLILQAIDTGEPPACTCGRCFGAHARGHGG